MTTRPIEFRAPTSDEFRDVLATTHATFGEDLKDEDVERQRRVMPLDRVLAAHDDGRPVGVTASYPLELTIPGGIVDAAGVTWVGVLPSHRRRGILRELMHRQLADVHERGEPVAILWASEAPIYGRFGYGVAAPCGSMKADRKNFQLRDDGGPRGTVRLVTAEEAAEVMPPIHERVRRNRAGMVARPDDWWTQFRLADPEHWRDGQSPKYYAVLELDGEPRAFAVYRVKPKWENGMPEGEVHVVDAIATSPEAAAELWRFLFNIDLTERIHAYPFDLASPLFLMVADLRRLHVSINDGLWLRLVDLERALQARSFTDGDDVVLEVRDDLFQRNVGRWSVGREAGRTRRDADVALDVADLASAYLGAFSFEALAASGRAQELRAGALARATELFRTPFPPFCPEEF